MTMTDARPVPADEADLDALLVRAATGDCDAFVAFYDATSPRIYAILLRATGQPSLAEELLEGIYVEAWERLRGRSAPPCPGLAWMSVIAHRHVSTRRG
ncbi:MAG: hypothetical protein FJW64_03090 [Actinobacteria bacterium]|nr:hypothetical protein [Actinomycetota bacterium]